MPYRPVNDQVLIEHDAAEKTVGDKKLILAPDKTMEQERANEGVVVAIGPGKWGTRLETTIDSALVHSLWNDHEKHIRSLGHEIQPGTLATFEIKEIPIRLPMGVKPGDRVTWGPYTAIGTPPGFLGNDIRGIDFQDKDKRDFVLVAEHDLLAVIEEA
ncbi:MAG: co-chaperone GroES [Gemmatimonadota bacterium]